MQKEEKRTITIEAMVNIPAEKVWDLWNHPDHIVNWNFASDDWQCPWAKSDLKVGGAFSSRMQAKDGSMGFEFSGKFTEVVPNEKLAYQLEDGRQVKILFEEIGDATHITEKFEPETQNSMEMQEQGWQAILNNFKQYAEN